MNVAQSGWITVAHTHTHTTQDIIGVSHVDCRELPKINIVLRKNQQVLCIVYVRKKLAGLYRIHTQNSLIFFGFIHNVDFWQFSTAKIMRSVNTITYVCVCVCLHTYIVIELPDRITKRHSSNSATIIHTFGTGSLWSQQTWTISDRYWRFVWTRTHKRLCITEQGCQMKRRRYLVKAQRKPLASMTFMLVMLLYNSDLRFPLLYYIDST